jgi:site-specific recombinase XerD
MSRTGAPLATLLPSWKIHLEGRLLSPGTVALYLWTGQTFVGWLEGQGLPSDAEGVNAAHIQAFLAAERERVPRGRKEKMTADSVSVHARNLRVFFRWLTAEGDRTAPDPMPRVGKVAVPVKVKEILTGDQLRALLKTCEGQGFEARRDMAIILILADTGVRVSGVAGLRYLPDDPDNDVFPGRKVLRVRLKGGDEHWVPVGRRTAAAIDRYIRARARHPAAHRSNYLWLGIVGRDTGHMTRWGIAAMIERRGNQAGIQKLTPHAFRRTAAHDMLEAGMTEGQVMHIAGWKTTAMLRRYTADLAAERARQAHARKGPVDRL